MTSSGPEILDWGKAVVTEASDPPSPVISGVIGQGSGGSGAPEAPSEATKANLANRKLEMPVFEGWNPEGWIFWVEHYFTFHRLGEAEKLEAIAVSMEGEVLYWF